MLDKFKIYDIIPTKMKSYREQGIECDKNGNRFEVNCVHCNKQNLICAKYKAYCCSSLCRDERMTDKEKSEYYTHKVEGSLGKFDPVI